jgi:hypothetical protein
LEVVRSKYFLVINFKIRYLIGSAQFTDPLLGLLAPPPPPFGLYTIRGPIYVEPSSLQPSPGILPPGQMMGPPVASERKFYNKKIVKK